VFRGLKAFLLSFSLLSWVRVHFVKAVTCYERQYGIFSEHIFDLFTEKDDKQEKICLLNLQPKISYPSRTPTH
jgi:hypothetical protein